MIRPTMLPFKSTGKNMKYKLLTFQEEGVQQILRFKGRVLLADEMGLGKTAQAICSLKHLQNPPFPVLIFCPAYLKENWKREFKMWYPSCKVFICSGTKGQPLNSRYDVFILNYDILRPYKYTVRGVRVVNKETWAPFLFPLKYQTVIMDECHYVKHAKSLRSKGASQITSRAEYVIGLSGTPMENRPIELWNILRIINKNVFTSYFDFTRRYCGARHNGFGIVYDGATHKKELNAILKKKIMIRRLKKDVMKELGEKIHRTVFLGNITEDYRKLENRTIPLLDDLKNKNNPKALALFSHLTMETGKIKASAVAEWSLDLLSQEDSLVIFTHHKVVAGMIHSQLKIKKVKCELGTGDVSLEGRQKLRDDFQAEKYDVLVCTVDSMGTGFTLTRACHVLFAELPLSPSKIDQASDRLHRKGQTRTVFVWYAVTEGTIDEDLIKMLDQKRKNFTGVLEGERANRDLLLKNMIKRRQSRGTQN